MKQWGEIKNRLSKFREFREKTLAVHGGQNHDPVTGAVMPGISLTSTYAQSSPGKPVGEYEYSRSHNPSRRQFEDALALMEKGDFAMATSSGMSATVLILSLLKSDDEILCVDDLYGGTYRYFTKNLVDQNIESRFVDFSGKENDEAFLESTFKENTKMLWIESPTNPMLKLIDIEALANFAQKKNVLVVVDNTFATPILQKPLTLGADLVLHSLSKYVGGHSDTVAGAVVGKGEGLMERLFFNQNSLGQICPPFDSWLLMRSLKTLEIRMKAHCENAQSLALWLEKQDGVERVFYPGLESHSQHELAKKQMPLFGGMLSFYVRGGLEETSQFTKKLKLITLAESLGGVESLVNHPALMTHASIPPEIRQEIGIHDNLLRLSVGIEDIEDLKDDLAQALT